MQLASQPWLGLGLGLGLMKFKFKHIKLCVWVGGCVFSHTVGPVSALFPNFHIGRTTLQHLQRFHNVLHGVTLDHATDHITHPCGGSMALSRRADVHLFKGTPQSLKFAAVDRYVAALVDEVHEALEPLEVREQSKKIAF